MHYDNPNQDSGNNIILYTKYYGEVIITEFAGVLDSSGIKFTYTDEPQQHRAGVLTTGHTSNSDMIIPPGRNDFTITALCPGDCTQRV